MSDPRPRLNQMLRLFTAIEVSADWQTALGNEERRLEAIAPGYGRWVDTHLLHITLVFLGNQPADRVPAIQDAIVGAAASLRPFAVNPGTLGSFGPAQALRVIWAGVQDRPPGALGQVRNSLAAALKNAGITFDPTPFRPHITLARARRGATRDGSERMSRALSLPNWTVELGPLTCDHITLIHSDLRPTGPVYTPLLLSPLGST